MLLLYFLIPFVFAFYEVKSLYERYQYYLNHSDYLVNMIPYIQPGARPTVIASKDIKKGELIMQVPTSAVLTSFDEYPLSSLFKDETMEMRTIAMLAHYKLSTDTSEVKDLIDNYNHDLDTPNTWNDEELGILRGYLTYYNRISLEDSQFERYKNVSATIPDVRALMHEKATYFWCKNAIGTFAVDISQSQWGEIRGKIPEVSDPSTSGYVFIPLFDLLNQYLPPDNSHPVPYPIEMSRDYIKVYADRDFPLNSEVYMPYGWIDNYTLLNTRGQVLLYNSKDRIEVNEQCPEGYCVFYLGNQQLNSEYLEFLTTSKEPEMAYRQGVMRTINGFTHDLRSYRRRVRVLQDWNYKQVFRLGIAEKWTAYKSLALIERALLKKYTSILHLIP